MKKIKILVAGCGSIGKRHLRNLKSNTDCELIAFDPMGLDQDLGIKVFKDYDKALDQNPNAVVIASPTHLHIAQAIKAAEKGCHLFIEKPLSCNFEGIDNLKKITRKKKLKVLIGFGLRFHKQLQKIKELLDKKAIGKIYCARLSAGNYLPNWRPGKDYSKLYNAKKELGGGVVFDLIHEIDYALWLFGEPVGLNANICKLSDLKIETEDCAEIFLKFKTGFIAQIHLDYLSQKPNRSLQIIGEFGNIEWDFPKGILKLVDARNDFVKEFCIDNYDLNDVYIAEMRHFLNCVSGKEKPLIDICEGERSLKIALKVREIGEKNFHSV